MICVQLWRARIGTFCHSGLGKFRRGHRSTKFNNKHVKQATVTDIVVSYVLLCFLTAFVYSGKATLNTAFIAPFGLQYVYYKNDSVPFGTSTLLSTTSTSCATFRNGYALLGQEMCHEDCTTSVTQIVSTAYLFVLVLLSGDIETNPGPNQSHQSHQSHDQIMSNDKANTLEETLDSKFTRLEAKMTEKMTEILTTMQSLSQTMIDQTERLKRMEENYKRIEEDQNAMKKSLATLENDMTSMKEDLVESQSDTNKKQDQIFKTMLELQDDVDRLESFSRRNNMKIFGVIDRGEGVNEDCEKTVKDILDKFLPDVNWKEDVVERAHRLGRYNPHSHNPRPIIVKFQRWGDLMRVMKDRDARARMQESGLRMSQDLTKRQSATLRELRDEGKFGFYVNGKLRLREQSDMPTDRQHRENPPRASETSTTARKSPVSVTPSQPINEAEIRDPVASTRKPGSPHVQADPASGQGARPRTRSVRNERQPSVKEAWSTRSQGSLRDSAHSFKKQ